MRDEAHSESGVASLPAQVRQAAVSYPIEALFLAVAVVAGIGLRFVGLTEWGLAQDEFYLVRSVEQILERGLPAYECGGYYMRGLPMQYIMAGLSHAGVSLEFSGRLIAATCSLISFPAVFLIGRRAAGTQGALIAVGFCALSLWSIEFARFGRMYAPFQAVFLWYLYVLLRELEDGEVVLRYLRITLSIVGVLLWEGGIFLALLNLVPPLVRPRRAWFVELVAAAGIVAVTQWYLGFSFRTMDQPPIWPEGVSPAVLTLQWVPSQFTPLLLGFGVWQLLLFTAFVLVAGAWYVTRWHAPLPDWRSQLLVVGTIGMAALNQFGILVPIFLAGALLLRPDVKVSELVRAALPPVILLAGFWACFLVADAVLATNNVSVSGLVKAVVKPLLAYPSYAHYIVRPWVETIPYLFVALAGLGAASVLLADHRAGSLGYLQAIVLVLLVLVAMAMEGRQIITRYSFFLLPMFYVLAASAITRLSVLAARFGAWPKRLVATSLVASVLFVTEDFRLPHLTTLTSYETNHRVGFDSKLSMHYYPRFDYRDAGAWVNERAAIDDAIVISDHVLDYYLDRTDRVYLDVSAGSFGGWACNYGTVDRWSAHPLLHSVEQAFAFLDAQTRSTWLVLRGPDFPYKKPWEQPLRDAYDAYRVYTTPDARFDVYQIPAQASRGAN